jgi:hypothetical protein
MMLCMRGAEADCGRLPVWQQMRSRRDFVLEERVGGQGWMNVVEGLELHRQVLSEGEQGLLQAAIESWVERGRQVLPAHPARWCRDGSIA